MTTTTRERMRAKVREITHDDQGRPRFEQASLNRWLDEEMDWVVSEADWPFQRQELTLTIPETGEYVFDPAAGIVKVEWVRVTGSDIDGTDTHIPLLDEGLWLREPAMAGYILVDEPLRLKIRPTTTYTSVVAMVMQKYTIPTDDATPFTISGDLRDAVIYRVCKTCWERDSEFKAAQYFASEAERLVSKAKRLRGLRSNEPYVIHMERMA